MDTILNKTLGWLPARWALALMVFLGNVNLIMVRVNLSVAIIDMVKRNTTIQTAQVECLLKQGISWRNNSVLNDSGSNEVMDEIKEGDFEWNEALQGVILGSFYYGYLILQITGGRLADVYGAKWIYGLSILIGGICAFLTPLAANWHVGALIALRAFQGLVQGMSLPAIYALLPKWVVPNERSRFNMFILVGVFGGAVVGMPLCSWCTATWGWASAFYSTGALSIMWCVMWFAFMHNSPEQHPRISDGELKYIQDGVTKGGTGQAPGSIPWKSIFTSKPVWALIVIFMSSEWGLIVFLTGVPTYMKNILGFSLRDSGTLSALPMAIRLVFMLIFSNLSDWLLVRGHMTLQQVRKISMPLGIVGLAGAFIGVSFSGCDPPVAVTLLCVGGICVAINIAGPTRSEFAPNFTGTMMGITNAAATVISFVVPAINGLITNGQQTTDAWRKVFLICVPIQIFASIFYYVFYTTELQSWNFKEEEKRVDDKDKKSTKV